MEINTIPSKEQSRELALKISLSDFWGERNRPQGDFDWNNDQELHHIRNFKVRRWKYAQTPGGWREWNLHFRWGGLTPSYERSHRRYKVNITICCWNVGGSGHLRICQQDVKTIFLALISNLTWLHVAVRKCKSHTDVVRICLRVE
jgi:hypothetical protein